MSGSNEAERRAEIEAKKNEERERMFKDAFDFN